ncbi:MAG: hypothetical protein J07HQW2_00617, partial [Haloquadratum walsbyi J07HQW2]
MNRGCQRISLNRKHNPPDWNGIRTGIQDSPTPRIQHWRNLTLARSRCLLDSAFATRLLSSHRLDRNHTENARHTEAS